MTYEELRKLCARSDPFFNPGQDFLDILLRDDTKDLLLQSIAKLQPKLIVEIGSWIGFSATFMAGRAEQARIICCDTWRGSRDIYEGGQTRPLVTDSYELFLRNTWQHRERIWPFKIDGVNGMRMIWEASCGELDMEPDLIFIDGGHEYESAYGDAHVSLRSFPRAEIVFDDYDHRGVGEAIRHCSEKFGRRHRVHGCAAVMERVP